MKTAEGDEEEDDVEEEKADEQQSDEEEGDEQQSSENDGEEEEQKEEEEEEEEEKEQKQQQEEDDDDDEEEEEETKHEVKKEAKAKKTLSTKKLKKFQEALEKSGVVYLSRIPPFMKIPKLKHLLAQYGDIGRVFLNAEDASARRRRKKGGGNTGKKFTDGWVEFLDKKIAKRVARTLNGNIIGGKKRSYWHDDIWNMKYLKNFKWNHLTEKIAYEKANRENKLRTELSAASKATKFYMSKVEQAKAIQSMENRKKGKNEKSGSKRKPEGEIHRKFVQRPKISQD